MVLFLVSWKCSRTAALAPHASMICFNLSTSSITQAAVADLAIADLSKLGLGLVLGLGLRLGLGPGLGLGLGPGLGPGVGYGADHCMVTFWSSGLWLTSLEGAFVPIIQSRLV